MKDELISMIIKDNCIKFGRFILTSGKESNYYIDIKKLITNPRALKLIAKLMKSEVEKRKIEFGKIAGPELGAVPIATALALETEKPLLIVRKKKKEHGTGKQVEGEIKAGDKVLLVEDVTTTGESVLRAAKILERGGARVVGIMVVVDREEGAKENIEKEGYTLIPLIRVSELFEHKNAKT